MLTKRNICSV